MMNANAKPSSSPPRIFDSARYPVSKRLEAFSDFSLKSPRGILNGIVLSSITSETPNIHRVRRQIGENFFSATVHTTGYGITYDRSWHERISRSPVSLCLIRDGYGEIETSKERRRLQPGDVYVSTTSDNRFIVGPGVATRVLLANLPTGLSPHGSGKLNVYGSSTPMGRLLGTAVRVADDALTYAGQQDKNGPIDQIITDMVRQILASEGVSDVEPSIDDVHERARGFIIENIADTNLSPQQIADYLGMSRAALYRHFKNEGGVSTFVNRVRTEVACSFLGARSESRNAIQQIASLCGFKSQSHFSQSFKRHFGLTPSEYKERVSCTQTGIG